MFIPKRSDLFTDKWEAWGAGQFTTRIIIGASLLNRQMDFGSYLLTGNLYWCINTDKFHQSWFSLPYLSLYSVGEKEEIKPNQLLSHHNDNIITMKHLHPAHWNGCKTTDAGLISNSIVSTAVLNKFVQNGIIYETSDAAGAKIVKDIYLDVRNAFGENKQETPIHKWIQSTQFKGAHREFVDDGLFQDHLSAAEIKKF